MAQQITDDDEVVLQSFVGQHRQVLPFGRRLRREHEGQHGMRGNCGGEDQVIPLQPAATHKHVDDNHNYQTHYTMPGRRAPFFCLVAIGHFEVAP